MVDDIKDRLDSSGESEKSIALQNCVVNVQNMIDTLCAEKESLEGKLAVLHDHINASANWQSGIAEFNLARSKLDVLIKDRTEAVGDLEARINALQRTCVCIVCIADPSTIQSDFLEQIKSSNTHIADFKLDKISVYEVKSALNLHAPHWNALVTAEPSAVEAATSSGFLLCGNQHLRCYKYTTFSHQHHPRESCKRDSSNSNKIPVLDAAASTPFLDKERKSIRLSMDSDDSASSN